LQFSLILSGSFSAHACAPRLHHASLLARLQIEGVTPDLLDDVFLLHFAFEATRLVAGEQKPDAEANDSSRDSRNRRIPPGFEATEKV
jgi:hypothetical protein